MAGTAVLAIDNLEHIDLIAAGLHFEAEISVAYLASESNSMEPVWEHYRPHSGRIGIVVNDNVTVLSIYCDWRSKKQNAKHDHYISVTIKHNAASGS